MYEKQVWQSEHVQHLFSFISSKGKLVHILFFT